MARSAARHVRRSTTADVPAATCDAPRPIADDASEQGIDAPVVQADRRLQATRFLHRLAPPARTRRLRKDEQVERLALARHVATREAERTLAVALGDERQHRLLAAGEDARLGALVPG